MKVERFNTEPLVVTGDTPDELERRAIERAEQLTGVSGRELTVKGWYVIYAASEYERLADNSVSFVVKRMRETGDKLGSRITVSAHREVDDDEPGSVDGGAGDTGDSPGLRAAPAAVQDR
jgi:hypothetical protein